MSAYDILAKYYDLLMQDIDYEKMADYFLALMKRHGLVPKELLDVACGTGSLSMAFAKKGLDVVGADASERMLAGAFPKASEFPDKRLLFILQSMEDLDLFGTVDDAVCTLDGVNHLLNPQSLQRAFARVSLFLNKKGLFLFDVNTPYKFRTTLGNNTFVYDYDEVYCVWQNSFDEQRKICDFDLTFFEPEGSLFRRYEEHFSERVYADEEIKEALVQAGLNPLACYASWTLDHPDRTTQRVVYVAQKQES